ncbi:hypothetical protein RISK_003503 [Rhodopirellula islandica]|uniref:Uncharacterized protein n=1 Tax=Rhodopirellula islandica TaxID=595434 RepID=A0A0J1EG17_RHOIS|nr:hypothetical protein RISK_003503 [Rhodopirellula islandica]
MKKWPVRSRKVPATAQLPPNGHAQRRTCEDSLRNRDGG